jgi:hypothetical protein
MSEIDPNPRDAELERKKALLKKRRVSRFIANASLKAGYKLLAGSDRDPREVAVGLFAGGVIAPELAFPDHDSDTPGQTERRKAKAGQMIGYDFHRPEKFPAVFKAGTMRLVNEGKIVAFLLDEIIDNDPDQPTPDDLFNPFDLDHIVNMATYTVEELEEKGIVAKTTHQEAYEAAGVFDEYAVDLGYRRIEETPVFQITPKGNTLVRLLPDGGDKKPQEDRQPSFEWARGLTPAYA